MLVARPTTRGLSVESYGPYAFSVNATQLGNGKLAGMAKARPKAASSVFDVFVTSGEAGTTVVLDDVVLVEEAFPCS